MTNFEKIRDGLDLFEELDLDLNPDHFMLTDRDWE